MTPVREDQVCKGGGIKHFINQRSAFLSEILNEVLGLERENFWSLLKLGAIYVNDERFIKDKIIAADSELRVHITPRRYDCNHRWSELIVFENDFFLVLNKPSGIPSHAVIDNAVENALTQTSLARKYPLFVTHRLDTLTSGLIVYGKKSSFVKEFNTQLVQRNIKKKYVALAETSKNLPPRLTHYMDPSLKAPKKISAEAKDEWAICELEVLEQKQISPNLSWVKLNLLTGRTHQIRAQLSHMEASILGDSLYGSKLSFKENSIALRSCELEFNYNHQPMKFKIDDQFET